MKFLNVDGTLVNMDNVLKIEEGTFLPTLKPLVEFHMVNGDVYTFYSDYQGGFDARYFFRQLTKELTIDMTASLQQAEGL